MAVGALACAVALTHAPLAEAVLFLNYHVTVATSPLIGHPAGPFSLDFQLTDGSGLGDANNTATISNLSYGGGAATGSATLSGVRWEISQSARVSQTPLFSTKCFNHSLREIHCRSIFR
jgi:hypothetical protein